MPVFIMSKNDGKSVFIKSFYMLPNSNCFYNAEVDVDFTISSQKRSRPLRFIRY